MFWRIFAQTIWQKEVSMEKELDLLIATEMSGDGDSVAEELRSVFAKRGVTVHRIEFRSGKDSVIRSVRANPQIHAVVLSQYQDQEKLSPRDIDQICSTAEGDLQVFVVVSEMRGSDYMKEIESLGIYTAVYQEDASFEKIADCEAIRPDIAGIMGAFGAALIARERHEEGYQTSMLSIDEINALTFDTKLARCQGCTNHCLLTINRFSGNRQYITGNRCERGLGKEKNKDNIPNLFEYKNKRIFDYEPLSAEEAARGTVGIPRVLNMYENYPFWAVFFKKLGFSVVLSPSSTRKIYELGIDSIPSESECYPAKLAHGHVTWLIHQNVDFIFYPCIPYERNEFPDSNNHYNCPIVTSYAENIKNNVDEITSGQVKFLNPFMSFTNEDTLSSQLIKVFGSSEFGISEAEIRDAVSEGWKELAVIRMEMQKKGEEVLKYMEETGRRGIVLAGRPYHVDPEINHGIDQLIASFGLVIVSEDAVWQLTDAPEVHVLNQWTYHSRMYGAAKYVTQKENAQLIQLVSFGCGIDAITTDEMRAICENGGKIYTQLKIDEISNLGAAKIRIRSMLAAVEEGRKLAEQQNA